MPSLQPLHPQSRTLHDFLDAWKRWSAEDQLSLFSTDFKQRTLPFALGIPGRSRQEAEHALPMLVDVVSNFNLEVHHVVNDIPQRKASVLAVASGDTPFGPFSNEYACFLEFDLVGEKITKLDEFMDSIFLARFYPQFRQHLALSVK